MAQGKPEQTIEAQVATVALELVGELRDFWGRALVASIAQELVRLAHEEQRREV